MATRTRRKPPPKKRRSRSSSRPRARAPQRRPPARRPKKKQPSKVLAAARWSAVHVRTAPPEAWGGLVGFAGLIAALGVYGGGAGPIGGLLEYISRLMIGRLVFFVPLVLLVLCAFMVASRLRAHAVRVLVGLSICLLSAAAMVHLANNNRSISAPLERLQNIGGIF